MSSKEFPLLVAVIFEEHAAKEIEILARCMPIWVIESPENNVAVTDMRKKAPVELTVFFKLEDESKEHSISQIIYNVDDHHQFDSLMIYGVSPSEIDTDLINALDVTDIQKTEYGSQLNRF